MNVIETPAILVFLVRSDERSLLHKPLLIEKNG
jgi:hypothetical protein